MSASIRTKSQERKSSRNRASKLWPPSGKEQDYRDCQTKFSTKTEVEEEEAIEAEAVVEEEELETKMTRAGTVARKDTLPATAEKRGAMEDEMRKKATKHD